MREHPIVEALIVVLVVGAFYGVLFALGITCPIKAVTGVSCPGCGMTRAWLSVLRLDIAAALEYHPLFLLPPVWIAAYLKRVSHPGIYWVITMVAVVALLAVYIIRMLDSGDQIVVFAPKEGLLYRGIHGITGFL